MLGCSLSDCAPTNGAPSDPQHRSHSPKSFVGDFGRRLLLYPFELWGQRRFHGSGQRRTQYTRFGFRMQCSPLHCIASPCAIPHPHTKREPEKKREGLAAGVPRLLSGRRDSNPGPPAPKAGALAGLRYAPMIHASRVARRIARYESCHAEARTSRTLSSENSLTIAGPLALGSPVPRGDRVVPHAARLQRRQQCFPFSRRVLQD